MNLLFDFTVDKAAKKVFITREFDADLSLVWDAFTKAELLDQWIAPKPFVSKTKYQDFKVGGKRFYFFNFDRNTISQVENGVWILASPHTGCWGT